MTIFEPGDVLRSQSGEVRIILGEENGEYHYINGSSYEIRDVYGELIRFEKGANGQQPCDIVERYYYKYQFPT